MAKRRNQDTSLNTNNTFIKGLNKDSDPSYVQSGMWTHARNAVNNTFEGDLGTLSNESSNYLCSIAGATMNGTEKKIIGGIHLYSDKWIIFSVAYLPNIIKSSDCEIGLFEEEQCLYRPIVQDNCLGFTKFKLITGAAREKEDCSWQVYWADGFNPDRYLNIGDPQNWPAKDYQWIGNNQYSNGTNTIQWPGVNWVQECTDTTCIECVDTQELDCDAIRLARLLETPCLEVTAGKSGGQLYNGSYMALIAYSIKGQKVTDWFSQSNVQPIWSDNPPQGSLEIKISADSENFEEFILCVVSIENSQTVAKQFGIYSTKTNSIVVDFINPALPSIPIEQLPIQTPVFETSDQIIEVNNYLLRTGPTSKFDFNYQPLANLIEAEWVSVEYPAEYYTKGGYKPSYLRDENYSFFIRWVYDTGDKSSSYHIPGRAPGLFTIPGLGPVFENSPISTINTLNNTPSDQEKVFEVYNTANVISTTTSTLQDGGKIVARGKMGYHESIEKYPDNKPEIWNSSFHCWTNVSGPSPNYDLCGLPIRHHKMPDQTTHPNVVHFVSNGNEQKIRILGVEFKNIIYPKDNEGRDIPNIVGYEILRGSREGNKTIIAKGMLNNMRPYKIQGNSATIIKKGLYPNHPFNTIGPVNPVDPANGVLNVSPGVLNDPYIKVVDQDGDKVNQTIIDLPKDINTFHSPDTMFRNLYLTATELKVYGYLSGISDQRFIEPNKHPKAKLISNEALFFIVVGGLLEFALAQQGEIIINKPPATTGAGAGNPISGAVTLAAAGIFEVATATYNTAINAYYNTGGFLVDALVPFVDPLLSIIEGTYSAAEIAAVTAGVIAPTKLEIQNKLGKTQLLGPLGFQQAIMYFGEGVELTIKLIKTFLPYRQYALQMIAYGFYNKFNATSLSTRFRFNIDDSLYLKDSIQQMKPYLNTQYSINNLKRSKTVVLRTLNNTGASDGPDFILNPTPVPTGNNFDYYFDNSLVTVGTAKDNNLVQPGTVTNTNFTLEKVFNNFNARIASHYGAIKVRNRNQYGQLDSIKQIPITPCEFKFNYNSLPSVGPICGTSTIKNKYVPASGVLFNGDTYINRYTEKNSMFFFYDWLFGQPDGYEFNYILRQNIPQPRFWANTESYDLSDIMQNFNLSPSTTPTGTGLLPKSFYQLDNINYNYSTDDQGNLGGFIGVKESYFYLATSAIRDFFVESDIIVDFRESGIPVSEKHYDPYGYSDIVSMLDMNPEIITKGNYYSYDFSLSISKLFTQYYSQGNLQSRNYDPNIAQLCYTYHPDRIIYSLPQQFESAKDSWFVYLANNYKEFKDQISGVKNFAKTGIFITFKNSSPLVFQGVDQLETDSGTKITIGDGGLFAQTPQNIVIADKPYEYGSSQNRMSVISTPAGFFYISQNQGKIFSYSGGLKEISQKGLKWWFTLFLPYKLTQDFPDYPHVDNPVAGIGCHAAYDNKNTVVYFSKKDYKLRDQYQGRVIYDTALERFILDGNSRFELGDPILFEDASWTVSYDPKAEFFISFHDWHPDLFLAGKNNILTTKENGIWKHNNSCQSFCNFYGQDYPFEIEIPMITGQTVTTVRSMEYILECYRRNNLCVDQYHVLDYNFDRAVVYNSEQVSGYLNLNIYPKNNIAQSLQYPIINPNSIDILFSKEENKYRFNQFWDITRDRGEFPIGSNYPSTGPVIPGTTVLAGPSTEENIWITQSNGYIRNLNQNNLDYSKNQLERKKFRHYLNYLNLIKDVSGNTNMILKISNSKNTYSPR